MKCNTRVGVVNWKVAEKPEGFASSWTTIPTLTSTTIASGC